MTTGATEATPQPEPSTGLTPDRTEFRLATSPSPPNDHAPPLRETGLIHLGPQSQSLFRSYGSNLPTSLTYIILMTRGCSPWGPDAVIGTSGNGSFETDVLRFSCINTTSSDTPQQRGVLLVFLTLISSQANTAVSNKVTPVFGRQETR